MPLYVITDGIYYKIGIANSPERRLKELQTGNPNKLYLVGTKSLKDKYHEIILHKEFHRKKCDGGREWFKLNRSDLNKILDLKVSTRDFLNHNQYYDRCRRSRMVDRNRIGIDKRLWFWRRNKFRDEPSVKHANKDSLINHSGIDHSYEPLLRARDVAKELDITESHAYKLMRTEIPVIHVGGCVGGSVRVRPEDLRMYITRNNLPEEKIA